MWRAPGRDAYLDERTQGKTSITSWKRPWTPIPSEAIAVIAAIDSRAARTAYSMLACPSSDQKRRIKALALLEGVDDALERAADVSTEGRDDRDADCDD